MKSEFAVWAVLLLLVTPFAAAQKQSSKAPIEQCSLAVVTRQITGKQKVCDGKTVRELARRGNAYEQNQLGMASLLAIGPDYSEKEALAWFERAALRGYPAAQVNLAVMYVNGWATPVNYGAALHWLHEAASQGFARADYNLGILYMNGQGVRQDYPEAFRWFKLGAEANDSDAETDLGYMYDQGLGCDRDAKAAAYWYQKAADAGNPLGENNIADMYLKGEGVFRNEGQAFRWFQQAAADGATGAQIKLAYMYSQGVVVPKDLEAAYKWVLAASQAGDKRGDELLTSLRVQLAPQRVSAIVERAREASMKPRAEIALRGLVP